MQRGRVQTGRVITNPNNHMQTQVDTLNQEHRLPTIILVDTSGSMRGYEATLHNAVVSLYKAILDDDVAAGKVELGVMQFNNEINVLVPPSEIYKQEDAGESMTFTCRGQTLTGLALQEALNQLEERKQTLRSNGMLYNSPLLFFLSDGEPYCSDNAVAEEDKRALNESIQRIETMVRNNALGVISVAIGNGCNIDLMRKLTGRPQSEQSKWFKTIEQNDLDLRGYFTWMSSYIKISAGSGRFVTPFEN